MSKKLINYQLLVDQVYKEIKTDILTGVLKPDTKLVIRDLCETYGVSDTPLKQALNRLVSEGLVESLPRRGMRVRKFNETDIHEAIEARLMIELYSVPFALENVRSGGNLVEQLSNNIYENEKIIRELDDLGKYSEGAQKEVEISQNFHTLFVKSTNNNLIVSTYCKIVNHTYLYYQSGINKTSPAISSIEEHREILKYLIKLDEENLRKVIIKHRKIREEQVSKVFNK